MGDMVTDSTATAEKDIWLRIINGNPLFFGVVVTGGVVIVLILCLILVCLSLGYRRQRHRGNLFVPRIQLVEEQATGQDLYDDTVSICRSMPTCKAHNTGQTGSGNEAIMLHKYEEIQRGAVVNQLGNTSHSVAQVESGIKNPVYYEDEGHGTMQPTQMQLQPTEQYNTLVQVGGHNSNDRVQLGVLQDSMSTYATLK